METGVIHKVNITAEAKLDVLYDLNLQGFDWRMLKAEIEEYIKNQSEAGRIPWWGYFRVNYLDESSDTLLMLFCHKGKKTGIMQFWDLAGVCLAEEWSEDAEYAGEIRSWLNTKIDELPEEDDWVVRVRVNEILKNTEKTQWTNVLEEVKDAFKCERDKEAAEKVALLQSACFEFNGSRRINKKDKCHRKGNY
jgi:hypothetical protein